MGLRAEAKGAYFQCHVCVHVQMLVRLHGSFFVFCLPQQMSQHLSRTSEMPSSMCCVVLRNYVHFPPLDVIVR